MELKKVDFENEPKSFARFESKSMVWIWKSSLDIGVRKRFIITNLYVQLYNEDRSGVDINYLIYKKKKVK